METYLVYLLKSTVCLTVFYLFFRFILANDTHFKLIRVFFYVSIVTSLLLPLTRYSIDFPVIYSEPSEQLNIQPITINPSINQTPQNLVTNQIHLISNPEINWLQIGLVTYLIVSSLILIKLVFNVFVFLVHILRFKKQRYEDFTLVLTNSSKGSFSFLHWVFVNPKELTEKELESIITHEKIHVSQHHTIDLLLIELLTAVMWFNPVVWMMRKSLQQLHEYLADEGVLCAGIDKLQYQALLLNQVAEERLIGLSSNFNHSLIKKRIMMMTKQKTNQKTKAKMLIVIPIAAGMFLIFSCLNGQNPPKEVYPSKAASGLTALKSSTDKETSSIVSKDSIKPKQKKIFAVSPTKMNVLYIGADNPLSIVVSDVSPEQLKVQVNNGLIRNAYIQNGKFQLDGEYIVNPSHVGSAMITLSTDNENLGIMQFRVKNVPDPIAKVAGKRGGEIDKIDLLKINSVQADIEDFDFDLKFEIVEFSVTANIGGFILESGAKSNEITKEQKDLISKLNVGDKVYFQDIKCMGPDGRKRDLNAVYFKIK